MRLSQTIGQIRQLFGPEIARRRRAFVLFFVLVAPAAVLSGLIPQVLSAFVDDIIPRKSISLLFQYTALIVGLILAAYLVLILALRVYLKANETVFAEYKMRLLDDLMRRKAVHVFTAFDASDLITRMSLDLDLIATFFHKYFAKCLTNAALAAVIMAFMFAWNWLLALLALVGIPVLLLLLALLEPLTLARGRRAKETLTSQNNLLLDVFQGYGEIRFYQQFKKIFGLLGERVGGYKEANLRFLNVFYLTEYLSENLGSLILFLPFIIGGFLYALDVGGITIGMIVAYNIYLMLFADMLQELSVGYNEFLRIEPSLARLTEIHDYPEESVAEVRDVLDLPDENSIEFRNVCFAYKPGTPILSNLSFSVHPGEKAAIMGASGRGKTTLVNLLLRYLTPTEGVILMGGRDISAIPLPLYLYSISYVRQQSYIFKMPLKDNISFGWGDVPMDKVLEAVRLVRLESLVQTLPEGLDTVVGEDGFNLSGGQAQRLALARALIREPQVLVLDEFTSSLDPETERFIVEEILELFKPVTILCITHSYAVAKRFDRIIEL